MQSRNKLNLALLLLLALLLTITLWAPEENLEPSVTTINNVIDTATISQITIERQGYPSISLYKESEQWWLESPHLPAKSSLVDQLLKLLESESRTSYPANSLELEKIGLSHPQLCIHYDSQRACFGERTPLDQLRYLQLQAQVYLIYDTLSHQLSGEPQDYVSLRLLPEKRTITAINLPDLHLQKVNGIWQRPDDYSADQIQQLVDYWQTSRALIVAAYQGEEGEDMIEITLDGKENIQFTLISSEPELILARPDLGIQYHLNEGSLAKLTRLPSPPSTDK